MPEEITPPPSPDDSSSTGLAPNLGAGLACIFPLIAGIIFLVIEKKNEFIRYWAAQALVFGGVFFLGGIAVRIISVIFSAMNLGFLSAIIGLLWLLVNRTRTGKAVLAASMNPRGVTLLGLELTSIYVVVWAIYGILAGIAGVLLGMFLGVSSYSVGPLTASAFSIVVLGGLGSVSGSLIAAFVVGYLETLTAYLVSPAYRTIPALLLLVVVMYIRPQGLLGRR